MRDAPRMVERTQPLQEYKLGRNSQSETQPLGEGERGPERSQGQEANPVFVDSEISVPHHPNRIVPEKRPSMTVGIYKIALLP